MSNIKISEMAEAESLNDNDLLTIVQSGINKKITKKNAIGDIIQAINNPTYTTTEGTDLLINNTRVGKMKFEYYGDTEQKTIGNLNRFNYTLSILKTRNATGTWSNNVYTNNSVTFTVNEDLTITVNGTASANTYFYLNASNDSYFKTLNGLTLKLTGTPTGGGNNTFQMTITSADWSNGTNDNGSGGQFTAIEDYYNNTYIRIASGYNAQNILFRPMLSSTLTTTYADYVEPTAGDGSPSPSYTSEVKTVTGENTINVVGRNLFSSSLEQGARSNVDGTSNITSNLYVRTVTKIKVIPNTTYYLSFEKNIETTVSGDIQEYSKDQTFIRRLNLTMPFTTSSETKYLNIQFFNTNGISPSDIYNIQLEKGSTSTTYEPYQSQNYELNLGSNFFDKSNITSCVNGSVMNDAIVSTALSSNYAGVSANIGNTSLNAGSYYLSCKVKVISGTSSSTLNSIQITGSPSITVTWKDRPNLSNKYQTYSVSFTLSQKTSITNILVQLSTGNSNAILNVADIMISKTITDYAPYFEPIELCKIGDYQDYIYNNGGKWFKHNEIGRIDFSTLTWTSNNMNYEDFYRYTTTGISNIKYVSNNSQLGVGLAEKYTNHTGSGMSMVKYCFAIDTAMVQVTDLRTTSPSGIFYFALATPIEEEITEPTLLNQLNLLKLGAESYYGQTNIMVTSEELQPTLKVQTLDKIGD